MRAAIKATLATLFLGLGAAQAQDIVFDIAGADKALERDIRGASLLLEAREDGVTDPQELLAAARAEYGALIGVLYAQARYGGVIRVSVDGQEASEMSPFVAPGAISRIVVRVEPGPVYTFGRAQITPLAPGTALPEGFARGEPAPSTTVRDAARAAAQGWRRQGHAMVDVAGRDIVAVHPASRLDADIRLNPGPLVRFGPFSVQGNAATRTERIRAIADFPVGKVYSEEELDESLSRLRRTGVFSSVAAREAEVLSAGDQLPVNVTVTEQKPRRIGFGAEVSNVDGGRLSAFWLHRNLFGGAERFRVEGVVAGIGETGGEDYRLELSFARPATWRRDIDFRAGLEAEYEQALDFSSTLVTASAGITQKRSEHLTLDAGPALTFARDSFKGGDTLEYFLLSLPIEVTYDRRDDDKDPTKGYYLKVGAEPFVGLNDESSTGVRLTGDARAYRSFGERFVLAGRVQGGALPGAELTGVPAEWRWYSGGGGTVRGQGFESLGVTLPDGARSGGASFAAASVELRAKVRGNIGAVGFADVGYVSPNVDFTDGESHAGVGVGLRYATRIGSIRVDLATPLDPEKGQSRTNLYIGLGQAF